MANEIDVRGLFADLKIHFRDRGPNTSRGNLSIKCPWCGDDPSEHLIVSERGAGYYCLRNRAQHTGISMVRLLVKIGYDRFTAARAVAAAAGQPMAPVVPRPRTQLEAAWHRLDLAYSNTRTAAYLAERGYQPERVSKLYDLRSKAEGAMACRVFFPCWVGGVLEAFTGRAILPGMDPRYLMTKAAPDEDRAVYLPRGIQPTMIIVEGPFDALRLAVAYEGTEVGSVALLGLKAALGVQTLAGQCQRVFSAFDAGVTAVQTANLNAELAYLIGVSYIKRLRLPGSKKDVDELDTNAARQWCDAAMGMDGAV